MPLTPPPDPLFKVVRLHGYEQPQTAVWHGLKQDYSCSPVYLLDPPAEDEAGRIAVRSLLKGDKGHYGPLEHPQITFNCVGFPHSVMQQARTHRVAVSFDVQSTRYTGEQVLNYVNSRPAAREYKENPPEDVGYKIPSEFHDVFYLRPLGFYTDREGKKYEYTEKMRYYDAAMIHETAARYNRLVGLHGLSYEHARLVLPYATRQHFVVSFNLRSLFHFCDLRLKLDAELEIRQLSEMLFAECKKWAPEISEWYFNSRMGKARLSP